ncbi:transposase [Cryobacterium sp. TMS1-20-1]
MIFGDDEACLDYLDWLRSPDGRFVCPFCQGPIRWKMHNRWRGRSR